MLKTAKFYSGDFSQIVFLNCLHKISKSVSAKKCKTFVDNTSRQIY